MCISRYIHIKCNRQTSAVIVVRVLVKRNNVSYHQEEEHAQEEDERRKSRVTCQARRQSDSYIAFPSCGNLRMSMCGENQIFPNANSNCQCMHMHADLRKTTHKVVFFISDRDFLANITRFIILLYSRRLALVFSRILFYCIAVCLRANVAMSYSLSLPTSDDLRLHPLDGWQPLGCQHFQDYISI